MGQFTLNWNSSATSTNPYVTGQLARYRLKGATSWSEDGFSPANTLSKSASTTKSKNLVNNTIYDFEVVALCDLQGEIPNSNGIQQMINFECDEVQPLITAVSNTYDTISVSAATLPKDFTKMTFHLKAGPSSTAASADLALTGNPKVQTVANGVMASFQFVGLTGDTFYDLWWEMHTNLVINSVTTE